jgi:hypothetical protein
MIGSEGVPCQLANLDAQLTLHHRIIHLQGFVQSSEGNALMRKAMQNDTPLTQTTHTM